MPTVDFVRQVDWKDHEKSADEANHISLREFTTVKSHSS